MLYFDLLFYSKIKYLNNLRMTKIMGGLRCNNNACSMCLNATDILFKSSGKYFLQRKKTALLIITSRLLGYQYNYILTCLETSLDFFSKLNLDVITDSYNQQQSIIQGTECFFCRWQISNGSLYPSQ